MKNGKIQMNYLTEYDKTDPLSIQEYSQKMVGKSFREIWEEDEQNQPTLVRETGHYGSTSVKEKKRNKGNL